MYDFEGPMDCPVCNNFAEGQYKGASPSCYWVECPKCHLCGPEAHSAKEATNLWNRLRILPDNYNERYIVTVCDNCGGAPEIIGDHTGFWKVRCTQCGAETEQYGGIFYATSKWNHGILSTDEDANEG